MDQSGEKNTMALRKMAKKIALFLHIHAALRNIFESIKNSFRYRSILKKNIASILEYKAKFPYGTFIETGTHKGNMIAAMRDRFDTIYSIELGDELYARAKERFAHDPHITLLHGDSGIVLPELLQEITVPSLFWLDAHYSQGETVRGQEDTPIERELRAILEHPVKNHVIMVDDARCFDGTHGYPTTEAIRTMATNHGYLFETKDDNFRLYPHT